MKQAVMYGAGNIGRGFIGQLFFESGYETTFIDVNMQIIDRLNKDHDFFFPGIDGKCAFRLPVSIFLKVGGHGFRQDPPCP